MTDRPTRYKRGRCAAIVLVLVGSLLLSLPTIGVVGQSPVGPGDTIGTAGTYELTENVSATGSSGLTVTGSPVELDGRANRLDGPGTDGSVGVAVPASAGVSSLVVRNLTLSGWETGVMASNVSTVTIQETTIDSTQTGIRVDGATTVRLENSTLVVDDGTVFEDVDRVVLENSTIETDESESIVAVNTTVYVGRNTSLTGGVRVRRGVVRTPDEPDSTTRTTEASARPPVDSPNPTPTRTESRDASGGESRSNTGGSAPAVGGASGGSGSGVRPAPPARLTTVPNETDTVSDGTAMTSSNDSETTPRPELTDVSGDTAPGSESSGADTPTADPATAVGQESTDTTARAATTEESTPVETPGFGVGVALAALVTWSVLVSRSH